MKIYFLFQMVDVIHTDAGILGAGVATGSVDFWPNGGVVQPGCQLNNELLCDHQRSWKFYAESVASLNHQFYAVECSNYESFKTQNCSENQPLNNMGTNAEPK